MAGIDALEPLVRASARDLGDDQDGFQSTILDLVHGNFADAGPVLDSLLDDPDASVRRVATWLREYFDDLHGPAATTGEGRTARLDNRTPPTVV